MTILSAPQVIASTTASITASNKEVALRAQRELLIEKDFTTLDRNWAEPYIQHNPGMANGLRGLRTLKEALVPGATTAILRVFADRDLVVFQERVTEVLPLPMVFFDVYRLEEGKIIEHWDVWQAVDGPNPSGRTIFDGPTEISDPTATEATRALVTKLVNNVFVLGDLACLGEYADESIIQHTPEMTDGIDGMVSFLQRSQWFNRAIDYRAIRRIIAEGDFAVTVGEGTINGKPTAFYDVWRVESAKVVEHWRVSQEIHSTVLHTNPMV